MKRDCYCSAFLAVMTLALVTLRVDGATAYVGWSFGMGFWPQTVTILPGDTVIWGNYEGRSASWLNIANSDSGDPDSFFIGWLGWTATGSHTFYSSGTHAYSGVYFDQYTQYGSWPGTVVVIPTAHLANARLTAGKFVFTATGLTAGKTNMLQCSTNLAARSWTTISSNTAAGDLMSFTNIPPAATACFYRVIELP